MAALILATLLLDRCFRAFLTSQNGHRVSADPVCTSEGLHTTSRSLMAFQASRGIGKTASLLYHHRQVVVGPPPPLNDEAC